MTKFEEHKRLQEEIKSKKAELEVLERKLKKLGSCYIIFSDGTIDERPIDTFSWTINDDCYYQGNLFDSKEDAQLEVKRRNLIFRFKKFRDECNEDWKADWTNAWDCKFFVSIIESELEVKPVYLANDFVLFGYFKNPKDAERAIELFGDEIKELFVDCEGD